MPFVYTTATSSDINQLTASAPLGKISRAERGTSTINFTMDIECATNRFITVTLYKNGVATPWRITVNGAGTGKPIGCLLTAIDYADPAAEYDVRLTADTAGDSTVINNGCAHRSVWIRSTVTRKEPIMGFFNSILKFQKKFDPLSYQHQQGGWSGAG